MIYIKLSNGGSTVIDNEDYFLIKDYCWRNHHNGIDGSSTVVTTVKINKKSKMIVMARLIMNAPKGMVVDHINHNTLDNRKCNLRVCTYAENSRNMKPHINRIKGIYWREKKKYYEVRIMKDGKSYWGGCSKSKIEAGKLYDKKAKELFGEFACLNFD